MNSIHNTVDGLAESVRTLANSSEEIGQMVGVAAEQQLASMEQIYQSSVSLAQMAEQLTEMFNKFAV